MFSNSLCNESTLTLPPLPPSLNLSPAFSLPEVRAQVLLGQPRVFATSHTGLPVSWISGFLWQQWLIPQALHGLFLIKPDTLSLSLWEKKALARPLAKSLGDKLLIGNNLQLMHTFHSENIF